MLNCLLKIAKLILMRDLEKRRVILGASQCLKLSPEPHTPFEQLL